MLTNMLYEECYYTKKETAVIGTTNSLVSIDFTIVVLLRLDLEHMFISYYGTIILSVLAESIIKPIIPHLSKKADKLYEHADVQEAKTIENNQSLWKQGMREAALRAK